MTHNWHGSDGAELESSELESSEPEDRRRAEERRREYLAAALEQPDPLDATLQNMTGQLMKVSQFAFTAFELGLDQQGATPESFAHLRPLIDTQTKVAGIVERLINLQMRREQGATKPAAAQRYPRHSR